MKPFIFMMGTFASRTMAFSSFRGNPIQRVYDSLISIKDFDMACRHPEISAYIHSCMSAMNEITLQDLGMDVSDLNAIEDSQCMNIAINSQFHITAFLIPKGSSLPLHDHPNMTVLSKVICGELQMRSFTVDEHFDSQHSNEPGICAKLEHEGIKTGEDGAWFLSPTVGNIHEFTAKSTCIVFDVLMPPYEEPGRPCNFYSLASDSKKLKWRLHPTIEPDTLPYGIDYSGYRPRPARTAFFKF